MTCPSTGAYVHTCSTCNCNQLDIGIVLKGYKLYMMTDPNTTYGQLYISDRELLHLYSKTTFTHCNYNACRDL